MNQHRIKYRIIAALVVVLLATSSASAQATRTWVSGVGDDANPCSRTAPCKTFAGAISKTAPGGEIDCLDPGGFGAVTITKALTIDGGGTFAGILSAGTTAITINAAAADRVTIRNVSINGAGTGIHGIRFIAGGALHIENCTIFGVTQKGVDFEPAATSQLFILDSTIRNNSAALGGAVLIKPGPVGNAVATFDGVRMDANLFGIRAEDRSTVSVRNSVVSSSTANGVIVAGSPTATIAINLESCLINNNVQAGILVNGALSVARISNVTVVNNGTGLSGIGNGGTGNIVSFGNNRNAGNTTPGAPNSTPGQQ